MTHFLSSVLVLFSVFNCSNIQTVRDDFHSINTEVDLDDFLKSTNDSGCDLCKPYHSAATMRKAEFCSWPGTKLKYFYNGKLNLETYITNNPSCIEGRYARVLVQSEIPSFLGYSSNLDSDCDFIESNINNSDLPADYKTVILQNIKEIKQEN